MDEGSLTFEAFLKLSEDERCVQYKNLSDRDKFRVRLSMDSSGGKIPCNVCQYYHRYGKCEAFPDGISSVHMTAVMKNIATECNGFHFAEK